MLRRLAREEDGVALTLALFTMVVLGSLTAAVSISVAVNQRSSLTSSQADAAFALAQDGLADAEGRLYTAVTGGCTTNCVPSSTFGQDGGTVTYSGSLSGTVWTLIGTGTVNGIVRTVSAQANVPPAQVRSDPTIWNYIYLNNRTSCLNLAGGSSINVPVYTQGSVCIDTGSNFTGSDLEIGGSLTIGGGSKIGTSSVPITKLNYVGTCTQLNTGLSNPVCDGHTGLIYASSVGHTVGPSLTMPPIDIATKYAAQAAASKSGCPSGFLDNDSTLNLSDTSINLFPVNSSYDCKVGSNEIKWNAAGSWSQGTLFVNGTFVFDGSENLTGGMNVTYTGGGTLYLTGTFAVSSGTICGGPSGCSNWKPGSYDPTKAANAQCSGCNELVLVDACWSNSTGSTTSSPCVDVTGGSTLQAGSLSATQFKLENGGKMQGPIIADSLYVAGGTSIPQMIPFTNIPAGTPAATTTVPSAPQAPTNWSG